MFAGVHESRAHHWVALSVPLHAHLLRRLLTYICDEKLLDGVSLHSGLVRGTANLRVADCSVMPVVVAGNTNVSALPPFNLFFSCLFCFYLMAVLEQKMEC